MFISVFPGGVGMGVENQYAVKISGKHIAVICLTMFSKAVMNYD